MRLYQLTVDEDIWYVVAETLMDAVVIWRNEASLGDENEPDRIYMLTDEVFGIATDDDPADSDDDPARSVKRRLS